MTYIVLNKNLPQQMRKIVDVLGSDGHRQMATLMRVSEAMLAKWLRGDNLCDMVRMAKTSDSGVLQFFGYCADLRNLSSRPGNKPRQTVTMTPPLALASFVVDGLRITVERVSP